MASSGLREGVADGRLPRAGIVAAAASLWTMRRQVLTYFLLTVPLILFLLLIVVYPLGYAFDISLHDVTIQNLHGAPPFVWFDNYWEVLTDGAFLDALGFSLKFMLIVTPIEVAFGLGLAVLVNSFRSPAGRAVSVALIMLPFMVSPVLIAVMYRLMLNGFIGTISYYLNAFHIPISPLSPQSVVYTLMAIDILQMTPFPFLILYGGLQSIDQQLYEAAAIDGAGPLTIFGRITLPLLRQYLTVAALVRGLEAFVVFEIIYALTGGGPGTLTTSLSMFIYNTAFKAGNMGHENAASFLLLLVLVVPSIAAVYFLNRNAAQPS
jgi:multiple sugar transport system permease protein